MNKKTRQSPKSQGGSCLCYGAGPVLSELMRRLGPPEQARRHFDAARVEFLKGLRAVIDARIDQVSKANTKGEKINIQ